MQEAPYAERVHAWLYYTDADTDALLDTLRIQEDDIRLV